MTYLLVISVLAGFAVLASVGVLLALAAIGLNHLINGD